MGQWEQFDQAGHVSRRGRAGDGLLAEEVKENMRLIQENGRSPLTTTIHAAGFANDWWAQLVVDGNAVASGLPAMCHLRGTPRR